MTIAGGTLRTGTRRYRFWFGQRGLSLIISGGELIIESLDDLANDWDVNTESVGCYWWNGLLY